MPKPTIALTPTKLVAGDGYTHLAEASIPAAVHSESTQKATDSTERAVPDAGTRTGKRRAVCMAPPIGDDDGRTSKPPKVRAYKQAASWTTTTRLPFATLLDDDDDGLVVIPSSSPSTVLEDDVDDDDNDDEGASEPAHERFLDLGSSEKNAESKPAAGKATAAHDCSCLCSAFLHLDVCVTACRCVAT